MVANTPRIRFTSDYPPGAVDRLRRQGVLVRVRRGAYAEAGAYEDGRVSELLARCRAVHRALRTAFAFSHETAAALHGIPTWLERTDTVHILQTSHAAGNRARDVIRHRVVEMPEADLERTLGLPVTGLDRTCVDCARTQRPGPALTTADAILRRIAGTTRFDWPASSAREAQIRAAWLNRVADSGPVRGVVRARAVLSHADGRSESAAESLVRWIVLSAGFTAPDLQVAVATELGTFYPDLLWSGADVHSEWQMVGLEYDGVAKYTQGSDVYDEKRREDALRSVGCLIVRATRADLSDSRRLITDLRRHVRTCTSLPPERRGLREAA
ncbi:type IV toxin-antitoxin system AbiEi family antitoxin domain-containing protein [Pseudactinotalea sp. Z1739]|uniref:type IV toxin-antitoxin system AbiEi family antitoxin domain-containing protein n=1 Tax=Pseudactinotalea sp. Z1739 TaxID=3413028 RepID=UPI003C7A3AD7